MSSFTLTLNGDSSELSANYYPPIELDHDGEYVCGLVDFQTYMSIPNISEKNNIFCYTTSFLSEMYAHENLDPNSVIGMANRANITMREEDIVSTAVERPGENPVVRVVYCKYLIIPTGSYELDDIARFINTSLEHTERNARVVFRYNKNTLKCEMNSSEDVIFDVKKNTIGSLLGFKDGQYKRGHNYISDGVVKISTINAIKIDANITTGAYSNDKLGRTLHEFYPMSDIGYKIIVFK